MLSICVMFVVSSMPGVGLLTEECRVHPHGAPSAVSTMEFLVPQFHEPIDVVLVGDFNEIRHYSNVFYYAPTTYYVRNSSFAKRFSRWSSRRRHHASVEYANEVFSVPFRSWLPRSRSHKHSERKRLKRNHRHLGKEKRRLKRERRQHRRERRQHRREHRQHRRERRQNRREILPRERTSVPQDRNVSARESKGTSRRHNRRTERSRNGRKAHR